MKAKKLFQLYILLAGVGCGILIGLLSYSEKVFALAWSFAIITLIGLFILYKIKKADKWKLGIMPALFGFTLLTTAFITNKVILFSSIVKRNKILFYINEYRSTHGKFPKDLTTINILPTSCIYTVDSSFTNFELHFNDKHSLPSTYKSKDSIWTSP